MSEEKKNEEQTEETATPNNDENQNEAVEATETKEVAETAIPTEEETKGAEVEELPNKDIKAGMIVRVHEKITDVNAKGEEKQRIQIFEGLVLGVRGSGVSRTATVRKNSKGWMVEKIYPLSSPNIEKIEVVKQYKTRRAKLTYLRGRFRRKLREMLDQK